MWLDALATRLGWKRAPSDSVRTGSVPVAAKVALTLPGSLTLSPRVPTSADAFLRCLARMPRLAPREASVGAFVAWLQELGEAGDWEQAELVEQYKSICELTHATVMPAKWFGKALEGHGCHRWQADVWIDGERWRPMMCHVPHVASKFATNATFPIRNSAAQTEGKAGKCARSGSRVHRIEPASKSDRFGQGGRHRADIVSAVA